MFPNINTSTLLNHFDLVNRQHPLNQGRLLWLLAVPNLTSSSRFYDLMELNTGIMVSMNNANSGWRSSSRPGSFGHSLLFDGSASGINIPTGVLSKLAASGSLASTWAIWFNPTGTFADAQALIDSSPTNSSSDRQMGVYLYPDDSRLYVAWATSSGILQSLTTSMVLNTWMRLMITCDAAGNLRIYLNGRPVCTDLASASVGTGFQSAEIALGTNPSTGGAIYQGYQDDISIWGRTLSDSEALQDYQLSLTGYPGVINRQDNSKVTTSGIIALLLSGQINSSLGLTGTTTVSILAGNISAVETSIGTLLVKTSILSSISAIESGTATLTVNTGGPIALAGQLSGVFLLNGTLTVGGNTSPILYLYSRSSGGRKFAKSGRR